MQIHTPTVFVLLGSTLLLIGAILAVERRRVPEEAGTCALWSLAFGMIGLASLIAPLRGLSPFLGIAVSNITIAIGYGCLWRGAALFARQPVPWAPMLAGGAIWCLAYLAVPGFATNAPARIMLASSNVILYCCHAGWMLLGMADRPPTARYVGLGLILHGLFYGLRIATLFLPGSIIDPQKLTGFTFTATVVEALLFSVALALGFLSMTRERAGRRLEAASRTDFLTGVANRRAFMTDAAAVLPAPGRSSAAAVLVLDLDHFKGINDRHGHAAGDEILKRFCRSVEEVLRPGDLFGRLGGEEFAVLLPGCGTAMATEIADDILRRFARAGRMFGQHELGATVSIGLSAVEPGGASAFEAALAEADLALYRAKRRGRNRVEVSAAGSPDEAAPLLPFLIAATG